MSLTKNSYPLDVNQRPHQTTQHKFMMHYVKSGDKRRRGQLEHLAQKNAGTKSKHFRKLPLKQYWCVCHHSSPSISDVPRNFVLWGGSSTNSVEDRGRESGGGSPVVRGSGGSCNLVQEIPFYVVKVS